MSLYLYAPSLAMAFPLTGKSGCQQSLWPPLPPPNLLYSSHAGPLGLSLIQASGPLGLLYSLQGTLSVRHLPRLLPYFFLDFYESDLLRTLSVKQPRLYLPIPGLPLNLFALLPSMLVLLTRHRLICLESVSPPYRGV